MSAIDNLIGQAKKFAVACYDMNSINELQDAISSDADQTDMNTWDITADEWREAIEAALADRIADENE